MTIHHHPDEATLLSFSAGSLNEAFSVVVAAHIDWCTDCRARVAVMDGLGGALLEALPPEPIDDTRTDVLVTRLDGVSEDAPVIDADATAMSRESGSDGDDPAPLARLLGAPLQDLDWKVLGPGVRSCVIDLSSSTGQLRLLKVAPGRRLPAHSHRGGELTLVLQGSYRDDLGRYRRGDLEEMETGSEHRPIVDDAEDCTCLVASESKARFKRVVDRMIEPFIGI